SKNKLLNTFSHQQLEQSCDFYQCSAEHWLKLVGRDFILLQEDAEPLTSVWTVLIGPVLIICTLKKKKNLSANAHCLHRICLLRI
ncbi:unnamed protein product, partial [Staurois parvus]